jgi:hypothetical protein
VALCSLLALVPIQEVMIQFLIFIYAISAATVGLVFWRNCLRDEPYISLKEALLYALIVLVPAVNTVIACGIFWESIDDVVIWRRKK